MRRKARILLRREWVLNQKSNFFVCKLYYLDGDVEQTCATQVYISLRGSWGQKAAEALEIWERSGRFL